MKLLWPVLVALSMSGCSEAVEAILSPTPPAQRPAVNDPNDYVNGGPWAAMCPKPRPDCTATPYPDDITICVRKADGQLPDGTPINDRYEWECYPLEWLLAKESHD